MELLVCNGYEGSIKEAGKAIGKTGDEGIDGIIKEDALGLDLIYIQAKKWDGYVGRPEIQKFAGALQGQRARKGIFITTGTSSKEAQEFISKINTKIVLIDGKELVELMVDHNVGVSVVRSVAKFDNFLMTNGMKLSDLLPWGYTYKDLDHYSRTIAFTNLKDWKGNEITNEEI